MRAAEAVTAVGIALVFLGSAVLFFYNPVSGSFGETVFVQGSMIMQTDQTDEEELLDQASDLVERGKIMSRVGFALIAIGSLAQLYSIICLQQ